MKFMVVILLIVPWHGALARPLNLIERQAVINSLRSGDESILDYLQFAEANEPRLPLLIESASFKSPAGYICKPIGNKRKSHQRSKEIEESWRWHCSLSGTCLGP